MTDQVEDQDFALDDDENVVEAHDPKNAEADSIASVDKAENAAPVAKKRKTDKSNSEKATASATKAEATEYDFAEDLDALVDDEATLSEGFKGKAAVIFEAAMKSKLAEEVNRIEENYTAQLDEEVNTFKSEMVEKVDGYLNYVVENWMKENEVAIQNGLRTEIAEEFMDKLQALFTESYIAVPDSKVDLVDELSEAKADLENQLDAQTADVIAIREELEIYKRYEIIREAASGLAETQVEKLVKLSEDVDFVSEDSFAEKVAVIKEAYFKKPAKDTAEHIAEDMQHDNGTAEAAGPMAAYVEALRKPQY
tara:strand:+ start:1594 stop:2523 length:930 start_codon:yes stop_codon:yes gene_type:complete